MELGSWLKRLKEGFVLLILATLIFQPNFAEAQRTKQKVKRQAKAPKKPSKRKELGQIIVAFPAGSNGVFQDSVFIDFRVENAKGEVIKVVVNLYSDTLRSNFLIQSDTFNSSSGRFLTTSLQAGFYRLKLVASTSKNQTLVKYLRFGYQLNPHKEPLRLEYDSSIYAVSPPHRINSVNTTSQFEKVGKTFRKQIILTTDDSLQLLGYLTLPDTVRQFPIILEFPSFGGRASFTEIESDSFGYLRAEVRGHGPSEKVNPRFRVPKILTHGLGSAVVKGNSEVWVYYQMVQDSFRWVQALDSIPWIKKGETRLMGFSQGGGLALLVAGNYPTLFKKVAVSNPFLCDLRNSWHTGFWPRNAISKALLTSGIEPEEEKIFQYLIKIDALEVANQIKAETYFCLGLQDETCPPTSGYSVFKGIRSSKKIDFHPMGGHSIASKVKLLNFLMDKE